MPTYDVSKGFNLGIWAWEDDEERYSTKRARRVLMEQAPERLICPLCHKKINKKLGSNCWHGAVVDHIIPKYRGGPGVLSNFHLVHNVCNNMKGPRDFTDRCLDTARRPAASSDRS